MLSIIYRKQQWFHYNLDGSAADVAVGDVFGEYDVVDRKRDVGLVNVDEMMRKSDDEVVEDLYLMMLVEVLKR